MRKNPVKIMIIAGLILLVGIWLMLPPEKQTEEGNKKENEQEQLDLIPLQPGTDGSKMDNIEALLNGFATTIYQYDTRNRKFYEGADKFMTPAAYQKLVPFPEEDNDSVTMPSIVSTLQQVQFYYRERDVKETEVLMEATFNLSKEKGQIIQYVKLWVVRKGDEYRIDDYEVVDTLEQ